MMTATNLIAADQIGVIALQLDRGHNSLTPYFGAGARRMRLDQVENPINKGGGSLRPVCCRNLASRICRDLTRDHTYLYP